MNKRFAISALLLISLPMSVYARCVPEPDNDQCPVGTPVSKYCYNVPDIACPSYVSQPDPLDKSLAPAAIHVYPTCEYTGGGYTCTAWPYSTQTPYTWTKFGNVAWVGSPTGDTVSVTCTPGMNNRITLKVSAPSDPNNYTTATEWLYCGAMGEY